jgi:hypothetical protein
MMRKISVDMDEYLITEVVTSELQETYLLQRDSFYDGDDTSESAIIMNACLILLGYFMLHTDYLEWKKKEGVK